VLETTLTATMHKLMASKKAQIVLAVILLLLGIRMFIPQTVEPEHAGSGPIQSIQSELSATQQYQHSLERQLGAILSQVSGAGQVSVMLTLANTPEVRLAANVRRTARITEEREGGNVTSIQRDETESHEPVMSRVAGVDNVVITTEIMPSINGVLVIATGAVEPHIREALFLATQTILSLPAHKVQVLPGK